MKFNPLVIVLALCVAGEVILNVCKVPVPPIIEHVILVLIGVLVPQESVLPTQTRTITKTETVSPPPDDPAPVV